MAIVVVYLQPICLDQTLEAMEVLITPKFNMDTAFAVSSDVNDKLLKRINDEPTRAFVITARVVSLTGKTTIKRCSLKMKKQTLNQPALQLQSNQLSEADAEDDESAASKNGSLSPKLETDNLKNFSMATLSNPLNASQLTGETEGADIALVTNSQSSSKKSLEASYSEQITLGNISDTDFSNASQSPGLRQANSSKVHSFIVCSRMKPESTLLLTALHRNEMDNRVQCKTNQKKMGVFFHFESVGPLLQAGLWALSVVFLLLLYSR